MMKKMAKTSRELLEAFCRAHSLKLYVKDEEAEQLGSILTVVSLKELGEDLAVEVKAEDQPSNEHGLFACLGFSVEDACKSYIANALGCFLELPHARSVLKFPKTLEELEILADLQDDSSKTP